MRYHIIALAVLACLLFYLVNSATDDDSSGNINNLSLEGSRINQAFDYYMTSVDSTRFSVDGVSDYRLQADRIVHYPSPEFAIIDAPRLVIYAEQTGPWFLSAAFGTIYGTNYGTIGPNAERNEERLELSENVVVRHTDSMGQIHNIYTDELTIYLGSRYLSTKSEVLLESMNHEINSLGMTADLTTKHITFLSNVRGRYD